MGGPAQTSRLVTLAAGKEDLISSDIVGFVTHAENHEKVPSCTGCYLDFGETLIPVSDHENQFLFRLAGLFAVSPLSTQNTDQNRFLSRKKIIFFAFMP